METSIECHPSEDTKVEICQICLESLDQDSATVRTCADHEPFHENCIAPYLQLKLVSFSAGFSPMILCPYQHASKRYISTKLIKSILSSDKIEQFDTMIKANMNFHCGGCSRDINLLVKYDESESSQSFPIGIATMLEKFNEGHVEPAVFYAEILQVYPNSSPMDLHGIVASILAKIPDPNFRSYLQNYHYHKFPRISTPCCKTVHCFRCKIRNFHDGKSCSEYASDVVENILQCSSCNLSLSKGDGCDSVTCYCGNKFNWEVQMKTHLLSKQFVTMYPEDTLKLCCQILLNIIDGFDAGAQAWSRLHNYEVRATARKLWLELFPYCPEKAFLDRYSGINLELRANLQDCFSSKIEQIKRESKIATDSLIETFAPTNMDKITLLSLKEQGVLPFTFIFLESRLSEYKKFKTENEVETILNSVERFLSLYGTRSSRINYVNDAHFISHQIPKRFICEESGQSATPTFAWIPARFPQSTCRILITSRSQDEQGSFSFYLCPMTKMNDISHMRSNAHVGIFSSIGGFQILSNGSIVALVQTRKLQVGDILTINIDHNERCIDLSINDVEYFHTVTYDEKTRYDYNDMVFGAILPVGTSVELIGYRDELTTLPYSFTKRPSASLLKFFRSIEKEIVSENFRFTNNDFVSKYAQHYESKYLPKGNNNLSAVCGELKQMLHDINTFRNFSSKFTWEYAVSGACFLYSSEFKNIEIKGHTFKEMFRGSAAFMAASLLSPAIGYLCKQKSLRSDAIAYMRTFPHEMNSWYDNDNALHAYVVPKLNSSAVCKCRCLPRHCVTCSGFVI